MKGASPAPSHPLAQRLLPLNRRGSSRSPFSPAKFPHRSFSRTRPSDALRRFGFHTGRSGLQGVRHTTTWLLSRLLWTTRGARCTADRAYFKEHTRPFSSPRAHGCAWRARIPDPSQLVAFRNTMCYGPHCVRMLPIPAVSRHDGAAACAERSLADGRKTQDTGR